MTGERPNLSKDLCGIPIHVSPLVPSELPKVTFDPLRKCAWASEAYRAEMNAWLLQRFGTETVAFMIDTKYLFGGLGGREVFISPKHAVLLRGLSNG